MFFNQREREFDKERLVGIIKLMEFSKEISLLADIVNYSVKGITGALGKGAGVTKKMHPVYFHIDDNSTVDDLVKILSGTKLLEEGDIVVFPSKLIAILEGRFVYGLTIENYSRCISDLDFARKLLKAHGDDPISNKDMIGLDKINPEKEIGVRYSKDPNLSAYNIADGIRKNTGLKIDVVITDSDSGGKKGINLIGCPTIVATPIGATGGLRLFYCMRVAVAAEMIRNNMENIPAIIVKPYQASRIRKNVGELRYNGFLDGKKEADLKIKKRK